MLTEKQQHVLDTITEFAQKNGKSPTIEELKNILWQKSKRGVTQYLEVLEKKGFLTRGEWYRGIRLGNNIGMQTTMNIPILWYANAGTPLAIAEENDYGTLPISKNIISGDENDHFVLRVEGTSMNKCQIQNKTIDNGSYVLIQKDNSSPNTKDPYLFIVNGAATLKKFKQQWEYIYLLPESYDESHTPIVLTQDDDVSSNGRVIDVFTF